MTTYTEQLNISDNNTKDDNSLAQSVKVLSEFTRKDIEKSYNLDTFKGTEAYFSNRYGWTLRRATSE